MINLGCNDHLFYFSANCLSKCDIFLHIVSANYLIRLFSFRHIVCSTHFPSADSRSADSRSTNLFSTKSGYTIYGNVQHNKFELDRESIGTSPMYGIGSPSKKYKDTSLTLIDTCLFPLLKVMGCGVGGPLHYSDTPVPWNWVWGLGLGD